MYANTCWGLLGLAVTFGLAVLGLPTEYLWLQPYLLRSAIGCGLASAICFGWYPARWVAERLRAPKLRLVKMALGLAILFSGMGIAIWGLSIIAAGDRTAAVSPTPVSIPNPFGGLTANQLKERTFALTKDLRNFEDLYGNRADALRDQDWNERRTAAAAGVPIDKAATVERFWKANNEVEAISKEMKAEYRRNFHVEANQIYEELCHRLKLQPAEFGHFDQLPTTGLTEREYMGISEMRTGQLAGAKPLHLSADALDRLAAAL
jgi:hypothetical protein